MGRGDGNNSICPQGVWWEAACFCLLGVFTFYCFNSDVYFGLRCKVLQANVVEQSIIEMLRIIVINLVFAGVTSMTVLQRMWWDSLAPLFQKHSCCMKFKSWTVTWGVSYRGSPVFMHTSLSDSFIRSWNCWHVSLNAFNDQHNWLGCTVVALPLTDVIITLKCLVV